MVKSVGKNYPISPFRRVVTDLMHFSSYVPGVSVERRMNLAPLISARRQAASRTGWCVLFTKAYAMIARDYPELRRSYMKFPWPRLYEHPNTIATLNVERELPNERIVLYCLLRSPENRSLAELDAIVRHHKEAPLTSLRSYVRCRRLGRVPWPFRRMFWWGALNVIGRRRCHNFGTFGISSVAAQGAGLLHLTPLLTSTLHYGLFDDQGRLDVRLSFDHRVMDGAVTGRILVDLESTLNREITAELRGLKLAAA
ncbi:MAG: hypothetical protein HY040_11820 [Planctomycetes bacterium]|nr:hypothetical protein [Planctomycetota bacterium]